MQFWVCRNGFCFFVRGGMGKLSYMKVDHALIADIYRSIGDARPFTSALDQFALRYGARGSSILLNDFAEPVVSGLYLCTHYQAPETAVLVAEFMDRFGPDEQVMIQRVGAQHDRLRFISDEEGYGLPTAEIPANIWNRKHLGVDRRYAARLSLTPAWFDVLSFNFPNGHLGLTPEIERDAKNYLLHFSTALEIARPFKLLQVRFNAINAVLDKLKLGVALVTDKGALVLQNNRFEDILKQHDGISVNRMGLLEFGATAERVRGRFANCLEGYCNSLYPDGEQAKFVFPRKSGNLGYVASLCPLGSLIAESSEASKLTVFIVKDPHSEDSVSVDAIRALCELTEAETEICTMLVNGQTINDISERRNVRPTTTRNQVASIFEKTGSKSQSQLIRFALNVDLPVESSSD
jgi:DNA-binding CsgD family transcriptional regulator